MARIDPVGPRPPYLQIADDLKRKILEGGLKPGARLPSSRELMAEYGVASMTVHQAIKVLRDEGVAVSWPGRGVYVQSEPLQAGAAEASGDDLSGAVARLRSDLDELSRRTDRERESEAIAQLREEINELKQQLGLFHAQLIELYGKVGQPYPHQHQTRPVGRSGGMSGKRRASGE